MVRTASTMLTLGTQAPDFQLPDCNGNTANSGEGVTDGKMVTRDQCRGTAGLLVMFICNHCPYVKHVAPELSRLAKDYAGRGLGIVGISSNDIASYPDDAPEKMKEEAAAQGYTFPYLVDAQQQVALAYQAACTPDFYLFDAQLELVYRGQLDDSRPKQNTSPDGSDLRAAIDALLTGNPVATEQKPSIGCNIKWISGSEPSYFDSQGTA